MNLDPELVATVRHNPNLDHDGRVHALAACLILLEEGPLADRFNALMPTEDDDPFTRSGLVERRRELVRASAAWGVAEEALQQGTY